MQWPAEGILRTAMHKIKNIGLNHYEKIITFRLTFLLPEIMSLCLLNPQQECLMVLLLLQIGLLPSKSGTITSKPYPVHREKTEKVD